MAKSRMINTRFWIDDYVSNLDPSEKLLFLYFLTNPYTDICGIYEVPLKHIALETGLDREMVIKIVGRFSKDGKLFYKDGWVAIKNFAKHQANNPKVMKGVEIGLSKAPNEMKDKLSIAYDRLSHLNSNSNLNSNPNPKETEQSSEGVNIVIDLFKDINPTYKKWFGNTTQRKAVSSLLERVGFEQLQKVIAILPKTNKVQYLPTITTPLQLEDKWASLEAGLTKEKNKITSKGRGLA